jgi:hypothetical protein
MNVCMGCKRPLGAKRDLFDWKVMRGYSQKDAAAAVLYDPSGASPIKQCCVVGLETNVDTDADMVARAQMKKEAEVVKPRETVQLYASNAGGNIQGSFIIEDGPFVDPQLLAPNIADRMAGNRGRGFFITNIAPLPERVTKKLGWPSQPPVLALWSGNLKIIPVIDEGMGPSPGLIWVHTGDGADKILSDFDKSYLQAEITAYQIQQVNLVNRYDPTYTQAVDQHVMTLHKQPASDLMA